MKLYAVLLFTFTLVVSVCSFNMKLYNTGRKPIPRRPSATTATTKWTTITTDTPTTVTTANDTKITNTSIENAVYSMNSDTPTGSPPPCPQEPMAHIGKYRVMTRLEFLTMVINTFSKKVDEYYSIQARFLQHANELIRASIAISDKCVIKRRRWLYKTCVKEVVTQAKQVSRQSIIEYEKIRKEAVWYAKNGACSLEQLPIDISVGLRKLAIDVVQAEFTGPGVESLIVECDKFCRTDPVLKNIINKLNSTESDRGNHHHFSNVVMKTDGERSHRSHSNDPKKSSQFISKSWS